MAEFEGKVALVTGATSGIGEATAKAFAEQGAKVVLTGRREENGGEIVDRIKKNGGEAIFVKTDVQKAEEIKNMVTGAVDAFGRLDYAVNNAGVEQYLKPLVDQSEKAYDIVMDTNVKGVWMSMKEEIPEMLKAGGGSIVNISSIAGVVGFPQAAVYVASKHAVIGLTKSVALEFAQENIRVNAILPAGIETPMIDRLGDGKEEILKQFHAMHPVGRLGTPEEIANACVWLCSDKASFVTGTSIRVDGGFTAH